MVEVDSVHSRVTVVFVDYDISDTVKLENVRLDIQFEEIPLFAFRCILHNIRVPASGSHLKGVKALWPVETLDMLFRTTVEHEFCDIIKKKSLPPHILLHSKSIGSVTKKLVKLGLAEFVEKPQKNVKQSNID